MTKKNLLTTLLTTALILYPVLVYFGLQHYGPQLIAGLVLTLALLRFLLSYKKIGDKKIDAQQMLWITAAALLTTLGTLISGSIISLKFYPVLVNAIFLTIFMLSLRHSPSAIEKLARIREPELSPLKVRYTYKVTQVWCLFFLINGSIACVTVFASNEVWALYNGFISYIATGCLLGIEFLLRPTLLQRAEKKELQEKEIHTEASP